MRTRTQQRPLGTDAATDNALQNQSRANNELEFYDSPDIGFEQMPRGIRAYLKRRFFASPTSPTPPPSGGGNVWL